ncbi:MAG TPA: hypothetical protein VMV10_27725 [Pirellulales bacterium]|nr:hypothetical protein [Pirellulales bacterium]
MRRLFTAFSRYRPRVLTLVVLAAIATTIVLANLSEEFSHRKVDPRSFRFPPQPSELEFDLGEPLVVGEHYWTALTNMSYGWPLVWRQYVTQTGFFGVLSFTKSVVGENHSTGRLAANAAIWLAMLALPAAICEWLLRRYRPRLRFSLRSMLVVVALAAALCGWFAAARNRANVQDALIAAQGGGLWIGCRGPKWLELIGADRYRRRIVGAALDASVGVDDDRRETQQTFAQLRRLPDIEYLSLNVDSLSPEVIDGLGELRQLRTLRIEVRILTSDTGRSLVGALCKLPGLRVLSIDSGAYYSSDHTSRELLAPYGALDQLERLNLAGRTLACEDLAGLAGLKNLKSLALRGLYGRRVQIDGDRSLLANLPASTHFESLDLLGSQIGDDDLKHVAALTQLKSLSLLGEDFTDVAFSRLAKLESLEELAIDSDPFTEQSSRRRQVMLKLKRLKKLHIGYFDDELLLQSPQELRDEASRLLEDDDEYADWLRGLADLREAKPELAIDGDVGGPDWSEHDLAPKCDTIPSSFPVEIAREAVRVWKEQQAGN